MPVDLLDKKELTIDEARQLMLLLTEEMSDCFVEKCFEHYQNFLDDIHPKRKRKRVIV